VAGFVELVGCGESSRARSDNRDLFTSALFGRLWCDPALVPSFIDDRTFDILIVTGGSITPKTQEPSQGAGQTRPVNSGKLFGLREAQIGFVPFALVDEVVELGIRLFIGQPLAMLAKVIPVWQ